jgi:hypothetical protein
MLLLSGAAIAAKPDKTAIAAVTPGNAQLVIVRDSVVNARKPTYVYETTTGEPRFIGIISNHHKLVLDLAPGEHVFMIGNLPLCDFMTTTLSAGKRYHAMVVSRWPEGFSMRPVRPQGEGYDYSNEEFKKAVATTTLAGRAPDSVIKEEMKNAQESYKAKWEQWQAKTPEQKALLTLKAGDSEP